MKLVAKKEIIKPSEVYNLHIENDHNYIVDGAVVSNCHMVKDTNILHGLMTGPFRNVPIRWGLTGTIPEEEYKQMGLFTAIGPQIGILTAKELQDKGVLAKCNVNILQTQES